MGPSNISCTLIFVLSACKSQGRIYRSKVKYRFMYSFYRQLCERNFTKIYERLDKTRFLVKGRFQLHCFLLLLFFYYFKEKETGPNGTPIHHTILYAKMFYLYLNCLHIIQLKPCPLSCCVYFKVHSKQSNRADTLIQ